jgi:hypothetical protein
MECISSCYLHLKCPSKSCIFQSIIDIDEVRFLYQNWGIDETEFGYNQVSGNCSGAKKLFKLKILNYYDETFAKNRT